MMMLFALGWYVAGLVGAALAFKFAYDDRENVRVEDFIACALLSLLGPVFAALVFGYWAFERNKGWTKRVVFRWSDRP